MDLQQAPGSLRVAIKEPFVPRDAERERPEWVANREAPHHRESATWQVHLVPPYPALLLRASPTQVNLASPAASSRPPTLDAEDVRSIHRHQKSVLPLGL